MELARRIAHAFLYTVGFHTCLTQWQNIDMVNILDTCNVFNPARIMHDANGCIYCQHASMLCQMQQLTRELNVALIHNGPYMLVHPS